MENRFKIIISNNNLYKEIELSPDMEELKIGTSTECQLRLRKELFFESIELVLKKIENEWTIACSDNLYFTTGDVRKILTKKLVHGDELYVKYQESNNDLFYFSFMIDFDYEKKYYDTRINISNRAEIGIGGDNNANIFIRDNNVGLSGMTLKDRNGKLFLIDNQSLYGIYVNGVKVNGEKEIRDYDFFSIANYHFYYKQGYLYTTLNGQVKLNGVISEKVDKINSQFEYPQFVRNTRIQYCIPSGEIEIKQPIPKPQRPKKNLVRSLIPSVFMLVLMVVLRGFLGNGGMFVVYSVCSMGIGIVMSIITYHADEKEYKREVERREKEYKEYLEKKEYEIEEVRSKEIRIRNLIFESLTNSINEVLSYSKRIYEKSVQDKDFLSVYLGTGKQEAAVLVKYTKQDFVDPEDLIVSLPEELKEKYHYIENVPIVSNFNQSNSVGIVGDREKLQNILKNITLDLSIRHFYKEVKLYFVLGDTDIDSMEWVRWIRHVYNEEIGIRNLMCDDESRKILLENLYTILSSREATKKENETVEFAMHYVVLVMDSATIRKHPVSKYVEDCSKYGFTFVFFEEYEEFLPKGCTEIIRLENDYNQGKLLFSENGDEKVTFSYESIPDETAEKVALKLGAISVDEVSLESELTKNISMFELLNILSVDDLDLKERWETSQVYKSMAAPLGVRTKNEIVYLDLSDKSTAHGPHGLVAGTTGSGKSEILQTYVLSMATLFHPYDVGFVIIDFKGGGMANQFENLPHMMGAITNIDGREINRSLLSIKAELVKRQAMFAEAKVNHINDYIKLYKRGEVKEPMPHLIIIVDEFAELKAEFPDFMKELISAARIGRTLGVHLILATQKPAGVVDSQIWSNSKFKLCLKVQTKEDSNEVIKTPLAAEIVEPGRAYFQVGNNEIFELFQSAYSGVKVQNNSDDKSKVFAIYALNIWGKRTLVYTNKKKTNNENAKNQLQAIVDYVETFCKNESILKLNGICLPPLADLVKKEHLQRFNSREEQSIIVPVGLYDDPERQIQDNYCIDFSENNTYIIGSAMTGKTTFLQTILLQLMTHYTPDEVNVYIIDCGNMALKVFEASNLVGGVVVPAEEERVINLFKLLFRSIEERKQKFSEKGLGTYKAYKEAGYTDLPQIILMIDNLASFREYYDNLMDDFLSLSREGTSLGISIVATATQTNAMNYKALSNYGTRVSFVCNDSNEYMNIFDRCRMVPKDTAGRGLCVVDKRIVEFQAVLAVEGEKEYIRVENIKREIKECNSRYSNQHAKSIPYVPEIIMKSQIGLYNQNSYKEPYNIPIGINFSTVEMEVLDISTVGYFAITGKAKWGKTNFVRNLLGSLQENILNSVTTAYVFDDSRMSLGFSQEYGFVEQYEVDEVAIDLVLDIFIEEINKRVNLMRNKNEEEIEHILKAQPLLLLIIENKHLIDFISKKEDLLNKFKMLLDSLSGLKMCVIFSNIENANVGFNTPELYKVIKNNKKVFVFEDASEVKFVDVSVKQQKDNAKALKKGDVYRCFNNNMHRIRTIFVD